MCVCTCAYEEQKGEEKGLEVEEGELEEMGVSCGEPIARRVFLNVEE